MPPLAAIVSPSLWSFRSGLHVPMRPCAHPPPRLLLLPSCSFSSRFASSLLLVLPLLFLALVLVLLSVSLRRRLLLLVCCPGPSIPGALFPRPSGSGRIASPGVPVRCTGCTPGLFAVFPLPPRTLQSMSPGSPPDDPVRGLGCASLRPGCSNPVRLFVLFFPLPRTLLPMAPGSPLDDPVRRPGLCSTLPWMLHSWASFCGILSVASDAPVRGAGFTPGRSSPGAIAVLHAAPDAPIQGVFLSYSLRRLRRSSPGRLFIVLFFVFSPLPRTLQSVAPGSPPDDPVRGLAPCFIPPWMLQSWASVCHILPAASDAPVRGTGFTPGRSSPGASAVLLPAPAAPTRGVFLSYSLRCLGRSSPRHRVHPRTIQSGGLRRASFPPGCSNPGGLFVVPSPPPRTLQSVAPGSPPDDPVRGSMLCFNLPRQLHSGASFCRILPVASYAPVRGTGFTPGRSSPGASAVLLPAPAAPTRGVFLSYSLRCLGRSSPRHRVHPRTIQSGALRRASFPPGCSNLGGLFVVLSPPPRTLQSVALGSPPDDPVRGLMLCFIPPRQLHSGASFCLIPPVASDAPVRGARFTPGRSSPGLNVVLHPAPAAPFRGVLLSYSPRCLGRFSLWHRVHPRTIQSGGWGLAPSRPGCSNPGRHISFSPC